MNLRVIAPIYLLLAAHAVKELRARGVLLVHESPCPGTHIPVPDISDPRELNGISYGVEGEGGHSDRLRADPVRV